MFNLLTSSPYFPLAIVFVVIGSAFIASGIALLFKSRIATFLIRASAGVILLTMGITSGLIGLGIQGYQALTHEEIAATIAVSPTGPQQFNAHFYFPDGKESSFIIAGDEIYIDAHILKWKPLINLIGLHTSYELDRVGGRYHDIAQELNSLRTLHMLSEEKSVNLFRLRQLHNSLSIFFDAQYGSATFVPVTKSTKFELRVSTTGLLMREMNETLSH